MASPRCGTGRQLSACKRIQDVQASLSEDASYGQGSDLFVFEKVAARAGCAGTQARCAQSALIKVFFSLIFSVCGLILFFFAARLAPVEVPVWAWFRWWFG